MLMTTSTGGPLKIGGKKLNPILTVTRYVKWSVLTVVALPTHAYRPAFTDKKLTFSQKWANYLQSLASVVCRSLSAVYPR